MVQLLQAKSASRQRLTPASFTPTGTGVPNAVMERDLAHLGVSANGHNGAGFRAKVPLSPLAC